MRPSKAHQWKDIVNNDIHKGLLSFPIGFTVIIKCEDGEPWKHGVIKEANKSDHTGRSYIVRVTKTKGNWMISGYFHGHNTCQAWQNVQTIYSRLMDTYST